MKYYPGTFQLLPVKKGPCPKLLAAKVEGDRIGRNTPRTAIPLAIALIDDIAYQLMSENQSMLGDSVELLKHTGTSQTSLLVRD
jgi:hypothetical protein